MSVKFLFQIISFTITRSFISWAAMSFVLHYCHDVERCSVWFLRYQLLQTRVWSLGLYPNWKMEISLTYTTLFLSWRKSPSDMFYAKLPALTIPGPLDFLLTYVVLAYLHNCTQCMWNFLYLLFFLVFRKFFIPLLFFLSLFPSLFCWRAHLDSLKSPSRLQHLTMSSELTVQSERAFQKVSTIITPCCTFEVYQFMKNALLGY